MIALDAMQGISVGVVHFRAGGGKLQRQIGNIAERAVVIDREAALEIADFGALRSEEHTSELQSLMRISYAVFCLNKIHSTHATLLTKLRTITDPTANPQHYSDQYNM